jgi:uncharacterized protein YuzE
MKIDYDQANDILSMLFSASPVEESDESKPGVILDYDAAGNAVGMEILDASRRMDNPTAVGLSVRAGCATRPSRGVRVRPPRQAAASR